MSTQATRTVLDHCGWMNSKDGRGFADYAFGGSDIEQALCYL